MKKGVSMVSPIVDGLPQTIAGLISPLATWEDGLQSISSKKAYAVLLLFLPPEKGSPWARILFTKRSLALKSHPGQISLPGGRRETFDANPTATAIREAQEETGVDPQKIAILGALPRLSSLGGDPVFPIIGAAPVEVTDLTPNQEEVAEIFALEWPHFVKEKGQTFIVNLFGIQRTSRVFLAAGRKIWGFTAYVLDTAHFDPPAAT